MDKKDKVCSQQTKQAMKLLRPKQKTKQKDIREIIKKQKKPSKSVDQQGQHDGIGKEKKINKQNKTKIQSRMKSSTRKKGA